MINLHASAELSAQRIHDKTSNHRSFIARDCLMLSLLGTDKAHHLEKLICRPGISPLSFAILVGQENLQIIDVYRSVHINISHLVTTRRLHTICPILKQYGKILLIYNTVRI
jgi:hypothetical protein